jgi:predicted nucleic-acid-binding Zn-ribbon protein
MSEQGKCPKCGSAELIPGVRIVERGEGGTKWSLHVEVYEKPDAILFKGPHAGTLTATICGQCGFAELFVSNPHELLAVYKKRSGV